MNFSHSSRFDTSTFKTDILLCDYDPNASFGGIYDSSLKFIKENQLDLVWLYRRFVGLFGQVSDNDRGWRCEYWGKMMRGACFVAAATRDKRLYEILKDSVIELLEKQDSDGRITTYGKDTEFSGWDIWGRKYILLGLQYFYEICDDEILNEKIKTAMCRHADYIISHIGEDKIAINETSSFWLGINSMSILEPMVRLYNLTGNERYFDFSEYIVKVGESDAAPIFKLAEEDALFPYQYPVTKAYEMMSCFEGLAEFYRVTGIQRYKTAVLNFGRRVIESDLTVIGCSGCTHELFDHSAFSQTDDKFTGIMQETCVSVTLMKLMSQLLRLSGDASFADVIENSFFNAYLGSLNTHRNDVAAHFKNCSPIYGFLPFDSYSPLRSGIRGTKVGGLMKMENNFFYGCCACIGSAGIGLIPRIAALRSQSGIYLNFYLPGDISCLTPKGQQMRFEIAGNYPYDSKLTVKIHLDSPESAELSFRIPEWSRTTDLFVNGEKRSVKAGYCKINRLWQNGDCVVLMLDSRVHFVQPTDPTAGYVALKRGAIVLAADARIGFDDSKPIKFVCNQDGSAVTADACAPEIPDCNICIEAKTEDGTIRLVDYSSAGKTYDESSRFAAWIRCRLN